jgi:hypothetical protein
VIKRIILFLAMVLCLSFLTACSSTQNASKSSEKLIDVNQFSRISSSELKQIMGEPEKIEGYAWNNPKTKEKISGQLYIYQNNKYDFILFDDKVVRMNIYSDKYNDKNKKGIAFTDEKSLFAMFGITPSKDIQKVADTGFVLRYQKISDKVADVWISDIDKENKTFNNAKITYNLNYF